MRVTSPCIDAGDPNSPVAEEPQPNGGRINLGTYGGTAEASKSYQAPPTPEPPVVRPMTLHVGQEGVIDDVASTTVRSSSKIATHTHRGFGGTRLWC